MKTENTDITRFGVTRRWSDAVIFGGVAYFVEVPEDTAVSPREQFQQVLDLVNERLAIVGSDRTRLLQVMIYLPEPTDLAEFNSLWDAWVPEGHAPQSSMYSRTACIKGLPHRTRRHRSDLDEVESRVFRGVEVCSFERFAIDAQSV